MTKALIIAEKPSVAADIARALGGFTKQQDYFESDDYVLSSAVGHLLELQAPEEFDVKRGKWSFAHLPVIPPHFDLKPIEKAEARLKLLTRLIKRKDVTALVNACDAGREGELIFRYIAQHARARQPVQRLWLQSMTPAAIREAFAQLRSDDEMQPLADAARCRSEADWLVGINGTRAMTAFNSKDGGFFLTTVGRVQTPTLAIVVDREDRIRKFVPRDFWEVRATFGAQAGAYEGRWFDPGFRKPEDDEHARAERLWDRGKAEAIVAACAGKAGTVSEEAKPTTQLSPLLFDLTSLQREANGRFGFSAKTTLSLAQALYEKHKVLTYPRTDAHALPEDYLKVAQQTVKVLAGAREYAPFAKAIEKNGWIRPNKRIFDNSKISDHFAIIPTLEAPRALSEAEQKIYDLVVKRFLAVFHPAAEYLVTTRITTVERHQFKTEGKVLVEPGWLAIYGKEAQEEQGSLVKVDAGERVRTEAIEAVGLATKPPARYNEATLLSAMEGAGKLVDDEDLRAAMAGKGLGTPATRAAIIEGLIAEKYLVRDGKDLHPTAKAFQLLTLLRGLGVDELTHPELTGDWEYQLAQMERGKLKRDAFMREIAQMTSKLVQRAKSYESDTVPGDYATLRTPCPKCGGTVQENYRRFACTACDFSITKHPASRSFEYDEVEQLLRDRQIGPLQGFRSKMGRPFAAVLKITPEHKLEFDFGNAPGADDNTEPVDFSGATAVGACPKCRSTVYEQPMAYVCENSVGPNKSCDFRSGKVILQQEIAPEQMRKLLETGRTDLLRSFVSNKTRRKFSAFLVKKPDGGVGFEFEPRGKAAAGGDGAAPATAGAGKTAGRAARPAAAAPRAAAAGAADAAARAVAKPAAKPAARSTAKPAARAAAKTVARSAPKAAPRSASKATKAGGGGAR
ncbi:MAG: DNA topoisomerase III [Burkholderiales bacterium]|nr:DNA topoisomerase III [Burkholderiales bacterium]MCA3216793.1 DNA topoisomerase III [Burkholderiales bacterium]